VKRVAKAKMDEHGRVQIPLKAIKELGLKSGSEFELKQENGALILKIIIQKNSRIKSPPLSDSEIADIEESEREFATQAPQVYDNTSDLLNALHAEREKTHSPKRRAK
jgi:bifunctional DNA-binding transcriptional regulator/antitoxin component of YhaV-PrlF toxin-antitoxin module